MKKLLLMTLSFAVVGVLSAQTGKTPAKTAPKFTPPKVVKATSSVIQPQLKNTIDSISYAIGVSAGTFYKQQGIKQLNTTLMSKALNDVLAGKPTAMDENAAGACMNAYMSHAQAAKTQPNIQAGEDFLAKNKLRAGVKTTPSGLQIETVTEGTGPKPAATDTVVCNYKGTLINGTEFDNSYTRGEPISFPLNRVIPGWTEGLQLMSEGGKYKLYIPYALAYGAFDNGPIPGGSALLFEIELLKVKKAVPQGDVQQKLNQ